MKLFDIYKLRKYINNKPGIYCIKNIKSNKIYIGSSNNLYYRIKDHKVRLLEKKHSNDHMQKSFNSTGIEYFTLSILKFTIVADKHILEKYEQYYIDTLKPEYNILKEAYKNSSYKHTPEAIEKIRLSGIGRKTNNKTVIQLLNNIIINEYSSILKASISNNINKGNIGEVCRYKRHSAGGFVWKFKVEEITL